MASIMWEEEIAAVYDATTAAMFEPAVLDPVVDRLCDLAAGGRVLELAIGTGRVALPLSARGVPVHGIELSPHMVAQLHGAPLCERRPRAAALSLGRALERGDPADVLCDGGARDEQRCHEEQDNRPARPMLHQ